MAWSVYADTYSSDTYLNGSFNSKTKYIRFKPNKNMLLRYVRAWFVFINDPTFTDMTMKLLSDTIDDNYANDSILYSSLTTHDKADILTLDNGIKELYFKFSDVPLNKDTWYRLAITTTGASFSYSGAGVGSTIGWKLSYPHPVYTTNLIQSLDRLPKYPYDYSLIGAEF